MINILFGSENFLKLIDDAVIINVAMIAIINDKKFPSFRKRNQIIIVNTLLRFSYGRITEIFSSLYIDCASIALNISAIAISNDIHIIT